MKTEGKSMPLVLAAQRLQMSWGQAWRQLLIGNLRGEKVGGRWMVTAASVEALKKASKPDSDIASIVKAKGDGTFRFRRQA